MIVNNGVANIQFVRADSYWSLQVLKNLLILHADECLLFVVEEKEKRRVPSFLAIVGKGYFCVVISTESLSYWLIYMRLIALWLAE